MTNGLHDQPSDRPEGLSEADDRALEAMLRAFFERQSQTVPPRRDFTEAVLRESADALRPLLKIWQNPPKESPAGISASPFGRAWRHRSWPSSRSLPFEITNVGGARPRRSPSGPRPRPPSGRKHPAENEPKKTPHYPMSSPRRRPYRRQLRKTRLQAAAPRTRNPPFYSAGIRIRRIGRQYLTPPPRRKPPTPTRSGRIAPPRYRWLLSSQLTMLPDRRRRPNHQSMILPGWPNSTSSLGVIGIRSV